MLLTVTLVCLQSCEEKEEEEEEKFKAKPVNEEVEECFDDVTSGLNVTCVETWSAQLPVA
jgi:hypothetical protein